jgi:hypothetical protein
MPTETLPAPASADDLSEYMERLFAPPATGQPRSSRASRASTATTRWAGPHTAWSRATTSTAARSP